MISNGREGRRRDWPVSLHVVNMLSSIAVRPLHNVSCTYDLSDTQDYAPAPTSCPTRTSHSIHVNICRCLSCIFLNVPPISKSGDSGASILLSWSSHAICSGDLAEPSHKSLSSGNFYGQRSRHRISRSLPRPTKQVS